MTEPALDNMSSLDGDMLDVNGDAKVVDGDIVAQDSWGHAAEINDNTPNDKPPPADQQESPPMELDVIVVGGGFSGVSALYKTRKNGMKVKMFEAGSDYGGVWYWNRYPGARVDSEAPFYQLNIPEVYRDWHFSQRFPDHNELRKYFAHVDKVLNLRKDTYFDSRVCSATFDKESGKWTVKTLNGHVAVGRYLVLATGLLHRKFTPDFAGLENYKGEIIHSAFFPDKSLKGKKVAIIGAGATAVQITQELAKVAEQLTVFLRRPSHCIPMQQRELTMEEQRGLKTFYPILFKAGRESRSGFPFGGPNQGVFDVEPEERERLFEYLWAKGAFNFNAGNYNNVLLDKKANRVVYDFWAKKTRARMTDERKKDIMAPLEPHYFFGTKRNPLERDYYEMLDKPSVDIVDLNATPLKTFEENGMRMSDDKLREFDAVVLATGFDSFTGSLTNMGLKSKDGVDMAEHWKDGVFTYLGLMASGFPNMWMVYSPQAPTAFSNGPTIVEAQCDVTVDMIHQLEKEGIKYIEPTREEEVKWKEHIGVGISYTLIPLTSSWWNGGNVPGKKAENMTYVGGIGEYEKICRSKFSEPGKWEGYNVIKA